MKKSSLFLIVILFSSVFSITDISVYGINDNNIETNFNDIEINNNFNSQTASTDHNVLLFESVTIVTNDESNDSNVSHQQIQSTKNIKLTEKLSILENNKLDNLINYVKHNSEKLAILERVNPNRIRDNAKFDFDEITSPITPKQIVNNYNTDDLISKQLLNVNLDIVKYFIPTFSIFDFAQDNNIFSNNYDLAASTQNVISSADENNQYLLVLLVPLSGYILLRTESRNINFINTRLASSSILTIILISSAVLTPFSIGSNYWGVAYADEFSFSGIIDDSNNNLEPINATTTDINATTTDINATTTEPISEEIVEPINATTTDINATTTEPISEEIVEPINATTTDINATTTEPISEEIVEPINATTTDINATTTEPISEEIVEPINATTTDINATTTDNTANSTSSESSESETNLLAQFNTTELENTNSTQSTESTPSLDLNGQDDFVIITNQTSTDTLSELTVSSWVKPDYSQGSQEFTVISKDNSFILSINNIITPTKIAKFSVFDGAKWTSVESTSIIDEKWTQLSATFNGTTIAIYVNGQLESANTLEKQLTLSVNGKLATTTVDSLLSEADIVIGAYVDTRKGSEQISQQFSGQIDDISLFDSQLNSLQIKSLYDEKSEYYMSQNPVEIDLDAILAEIIAEQSNSTSTELNSTSTEPTEIIVTELIVNATLDSVKETYLITENAELTLEFYDEYDVLINELEELENSLLLLSELEQELEQETIIVNATTTELINTTTVIEPIILNFIGMLFTIPQADAAEPTDDDQSKIDIANTKEQILLLKEKINAIKNGEINEQDIKEAKLQLESILTELKENANSLSQNNDDITQKIQNSTDNIEQIGDVEPEDIIQENTWTGNDEQITTEVYDSNGNLADIKYQYEKVRDGKFKLDLAFDSSDNIKPGLYKVKTTLLVDGQTHVVESEFAWGLVSLNTAKSIYRPGETADFVIVVLDNQGHPVCNSDIDMTITDPDSSSTVLSSDNGISPNLECGLYDAQYNTVIEGNHTISISAQTPNGITHFSTHFVVQQSFDYDIIRTAQSKIDPTINPNSFNVRIDIESFTDENSLEIKETIPSVFDVVTDANVQTMGNTKILTWTKNLVDNKTSVEYSYSIPLVFPQLYPLGPLEINSGNFIEARPWFVAADPYIPQNIGGLLVYSDGTVGTPKYQTFSGTTFGGEASATSVGAQTIEWIRVAASPTADEWIIATRDAGDVIKVQVCTGTDSGISCGSTTTITSTAGTHGFNNFDVAYEMTSGDALLVYGTATADELRKIEWTGGSWTSDAAITTTRTTGTVEWVELSSRQSSNQIGIAYADTNDDVSAYRWSGSAVGDEATNYINPNAGTANVRKMDVAFEGTSGDMLVVSPHAAAGTMASGHLSGTTWTIANNTATDQTNVFVDIADGESSTDDLAIVTNACGDDVEGLEWTGTAFLDGAIALDTTSNTCTTSYSMTTAGFKNSTYTGILIYSDVTGVDDINWMTMDSAGVWTNHSTLDNLRTRGTIQNVQLYDYPTSDKVLLISSDSNGDLWADSWATGGPSATVWTDITTGGTLEGSLALATQKNWDFAFRTFRNTQSPTESLPLSDTLTKSISKSLTESLPLTATATTSATKSVSLTESLPLSDTLTKSISKSLTESLPLTATATTSATTSVSLTESLPLSDTINTTATKSVSLTESLPLSDTLTKSISKSLTESLPLTATATTLAVISVSLTESLPLTATATATAAKSVSLTESLPLADNTVGIVSAKSVSLTESLPLTATATTSAALTRSLTESLPLTATATTLAVISVSLTESLPLTATATATAAKSVSLTESLPLADNTVGIVSAKSVSLTESLPLTATATTSAALTRSLTESLPLTATATTLAVISVSLTESLPLTATATATAAKSVSLTESLPLADNTVGIVSAKSVSLTESLPLTATATTSAALTRSLTESLPLTATATTLAVISVSLTESLPLTATATATAAKSVSLTESLPLADNTVGIVSAKSVSLTESLPLTATATTSAALTRSLTESLPLTATATTLAVISVSLTESLPLTATATATAAKSVSLTESLPLADNTVGIVSAKSVSLTESLPLTATATTSAALTRSLTESLPLTATATTLAVISVSLTESLPLTATATATAAKSVSLTESLPLADNTVGIVSGKSVSLTESLPLTATATTSAALTRSLTESLPLTATATTLAVISVSLTESLPLTATATATAAKSVSLTESLPLADNTVGIVSGKSVSLTESLPLTATATTSAALTRSLTESLPLTATATTLAVISVSLTESLPLTATATATAAKSVSLTESLPLADNTVGIVSGKSVSLTESLPLTATATTSAALTRSLTESLPLTATATTLAVISVSLTESLPLTATATATAAKSVSLTESLPLADNTVGIVSGKSVSLTESLPLTATATATAAKSVSLTESLPLTATVSITGSISISLTESLPLTDLLNKNTIHVRTDYLQLMDNLATSIIPGNTTLPVKLYPGSTTTEITLAQNNTSVFLTSSSIIETITIPQSVDTQLVINYTSSLSSNSSGTFVPITNGYNVTFSTPDEDSDEISVVVAIPDNVTLSGTSAWNGVLELPTATTVTIPQTTTNGVTTTYSEVAAFELGFNGSTIQFSSPVRIKFTGGGVDNAVAFYVGTSGVTTFINTQCTSDSASGMPSSADECYYDNGNDLIVWTEHFTKFGTSQRSTSSSSTGSSSSGSAGIGGGAGKTGVGPTGTSRGFGGILGTALTINEITYDRCEENMATILVSSDADKAPSVTVHTARSGSVSAKLANIQPYEQSNKITKLDKYLYEIPITSDETFLMVVVTEEKGVSKNTVQSAIHLTSCEGATVISKVPEEKYEEIASSAPKIFDVKFQIENNTQHSSETESEFSYVDNQDLNISAIVDAQSPLQRSELRIITMGQSQEYVAIKMDVESLPISNSTYVISATIPSDLMQEPAVSYWIHIIDEDQNEAESKQYNIGVKPISVGDVSFEMDISSIKESGSLVRPQLFVDNKDLPSYGIISLIVNGEVIYKKSQLFVTGETIVNLEWKSPSVDEHIIYNIMASVDLYDKSISTQSAKLHIYPKTITMLASEIKSLEPITDNDTVLADPALIYASNYVDENLRFLVIAPNGQCIIGVSEECAIHGSTVNQRGGLTSIEYEDQIIRVRYSGPDSQLERFSITSIDPLVDHWIVSLETSDGIVPQAQAMKDIPIKVKYRIHSETITVKSS